MPLSASTPRRLLHSRSVRCYGYEREDGLWDIEGHLVDTKTYALPNRDRGGQIQPGEPLHGMWLRLTVDLEFMVHAVEASTDWAPFNQCPRITRRYQRLVGLRIGAGWTRRTRKLLAGLDGCTHLTELLGPIATTAFQTVHARREAREDARSEREPPRILDTCHALARDGEVVKLHWPRFYTGTDQRAVHE